MAKSKVKPIPTSEMQEDNKKWFDEYKKHRKPDGYDSFVERFLCFVEFQNRPFNKFVHKDLDSYKEILFRLTEVA